MLDADESAVADEATKPIAAAKDAVKRRYSKPAPCRMPF
jgi:hypothetical protein